MSYRFLPGSYEDLFRQAQAMTLAGDPQEAVDLYSHLVQKLERLSESVLARRPGLRDMQRQARLQLAELLQSEGRYAEAIEVEEGLLKSHPEQANIWQRDLAILRIAKGEADRGLAELQTLADRTPDDVWNWILLGNEARIEGRFLESEAAFGRALEVAGGKDDSKPLAEIQYGRFLLLKAMGRTEEALAAWEETVSREPAAKRTIHEVYTMLTDAAWLVQAQEYVARDENPLRSGFQRGVLAQLTGDPAKAKEEWQAVAALDPMAFEDGQECWVEAVLRLGDPAPVLDRMQQLVRRQGTVRLLVLAGIAWAMRGERKPAQQLLEQSVHFLRRGRPPKQKLDGADWRLLHSLVTHEEIRASLKPYFAVVETIWG